MRNPRIDGSQIDGSSSGLRAKKSTLRKLRVPVRFTFRSSASIRPEASPAVPSFAVLLPAFSAQASAAWLVALAPVSQLPEEAGQASRGAPRGWPQRAQAVACAARDARPAQQFAGGQREQAESGSAQAGLPAGSVPDDCSAVLAPDDCSESLLADCSVLPVPADLVVRPDDSVEPEQPGQAARSEPVDLPADSQADSRVLQAGRAAQQSGG